MPGGRRGGRGVIGNGGTPTPTGFVTFVAFVFFYMSTTHTHAGRRAIKKILKIFFKIFRHNAFLLSG